MKLSKFRDQLLMVLNELIAAERAATPETWPDIRDQVLERHGVAKEAMAHIEMG